MRIPESANNSVILAKTLSINNFVPYNQMIEHHLWELSLCHLLYFLAWIDITPPDSLLDIISHPIWQLIRSHIRLEWGEVITQLWGDYKFSPNWSWHSVTNLLWIMYGCYLSHISVAQVVGRRTQDHKIMSSNPDSGLISKIAAKLWNRVPHEPPMTQRQWGAGRKLWSETCVLRECHGDCHNLKSSNVRVRPFPMISGVIVESGEKFRLDPDYNPAPLPIQFTETRWWSEYWRQLARDQWLLSFHIMRMK